jgi:hypothetical protein
LSAQNPFANAYYAPEACNAGVGNHAKNQDHAALKLRRPYVMVLAGLVMALALCGLGHRLAFYLHYGTPISRLSATRIVQEPRDNAVAAIYRISLKGRNLTDSQPLPESAQPCWRIDARPTAAPPLEECRPASFRFLIPFRSPPPQRFSLA